jgi:hypothetical protein
MDSSDQRKVRKNMEEINLTESPSLPESSELLSPEQVEALEKAYALDVATGGCKTCQSTWKPTRRDLIKTAFGAALVAGTLLESNVHAHADGIEIGEGGKSDCQLGYEECEALAYVAEQGCRMRCPKRVDNPLGYILCAAACNGALAAALSGCLVLRAECEAAAAAAAIALAIQQAAQWIEDNAALVTIGTIIVVGVVALIVVCNGAAAVCLQVVSTIAEGSTLIRI